MSDPLDEAPWYFRWMVDNVHDCWRWMSVQIVSVMAVLPMVYEYLDDIENYLSPTQMHWLMTGLAVLTIFARITKQGPKT